MSTFWNLWAVSGIALFLAVMIAVVVKLWRSNHKADADKTLETFDGIKENDAPLPNILFIAYAIAFSLAAVHMVLYPGLGNWGGLLDWQQSDDKLSSPSTTLDQQFSQVTDKSLGALAKNDGIVASGQILFQTHCAACHRENAQGQKHFPNLIDAEWLYGDDDATILQTIVEGRQGAMPGWEEVLDHEQVENLSYYVVSLEKQRHVKAPKARIELGKDLFLEECTSCHGDGTEADHERGIPNLSDAVWLHGGSIEEIQHSISYGITNVMPAFGEQLTHNEILALGAYIRQAGDKEKQRLAALNTESVQRGGYLARAGDCVACHSAEGGEPFAGGLPFKTPFGTIYSTNITPHVSEGIGDYSYSDFREAVQKGKGKHGYLYPAMPYTSYQYLTDQDMADLWEYLQSVPAVPRSNNPNSMVFPTNLRFGILSWDLLFMDTDPIDYSLPAELKDRVKDVEKWQRGKYWVSGLGHCSECHTPRNFAQALIPENIFQGNMIDGWNAPDITATELYVGGWDEKQLTDFLHTGHSDKGTVFAGMADVVENSLSHMTRDDISSIAYYLLSGDANNLFDASATPLSPKGFDEKAYQDPTYATFKVTCGACHGKDGKGRDPIAPTLLNNGAVTHSDPYNIIAVALRGLAPSYLDRQRHFMPMVSFEETLSDLRLAELVTFVRKHLGGRHEPVTASKVKEVREKLEAGGYTDRMHADVENLLENNDISIK